MTEVINEIKIREESAQRFEWFTNKLRRLLRVCLAKIVVVLTFSGCRVAVRCPSSCIRY